MSDDVTDRLRGWGSFAADGSDLLRATIAALLAVPDEMEADYADDPAVLLVVRFVRARMAAVVEGQR